MKVIFNFSLPTAKHDYDRLRWYERNAKRIRKGVAWYSGLWHKTEDGKYIIEIENKNKSVDLWVIDMIRDISTGRTRIIPIGNIAKIKPYGDDSYIYSLVH